MVGGTSPFGTRKTFLVFVERSILDLDRIYINGGRRGLLVVMSPHDARRALNATPVGVAIWRLGAIFDCRVRSSDTGVPGIASGG